MPPTLPTPRGIDPAAMLVPAAEATPHLSTRTRSWLTHHTTARLMVDSVWETLAELERAGHHPRLLAAVRFVLAHHEPTWVGRCRACRRVSWRGLWRRRRFPCVIWRQIRGELLGHLTLSGVHRRRAENVSADLTHARMG